MSTKNISLEEQDRKLKNYIERYWPLYAMLALPLAFCLLFKYWPMTGLAMAFKNFKMIRGIWGSDWNGFDNFRYLFNRSESVGVILQTLKLNLLDLVFGFTMPIILSIMLNEVRSKTFKRVTQTVISLPHFLSWAIYGGLVANLLSADGGMINTVLQSLGLISKPVIWLGRSEYFWGIAILSGLLKELGWGAIIYLAAIAGVDPVLYEAAAIDGATRVQRMAHVTLPSILPTVMIMIIFAVAGMLNNNFTQIYVLQNPLNMDASQVIDTYVYQIGMKQFQFGVATAASLTKSVFALMLLGMANFASKKLTDNGLF